MADVDCLNAIIRHHGITDFKWIDPKAIIVSEWVRMKCLYGCPNFGRRASCPPNTPTVEECRHFFGEYTGAIVFHFQQVEEDTEKRHAWSAKVNESLSKIERDVFLAGYPRAFLLFMDLCRICVECVPSRAACKEPKLSRPSPEGMAVDVFSTVRKLGYPIEVLTDPSAQMNRYAILMVE